ncbi:hypothetical protein PRIPAC_86590 [Pristionchus pacificus]|uniref:Integrase catalytic domain-containing protein n=1 Tax=Pristionchus pacificus TaxID=54126 RepID=A0A2A6BKG7_PRIPA|nr:hypothetical protein PRIPAC_86590 [Pristionchus pacificus]|eukprot:PDM66316.1 hypothetical protein PRIPAC_47733 [Pristionchus pacificus]
MTSTFASEYSNSHSKLVALQPVINSINDEISKLFDVTKNDEIAACSSTVARAIDSAHSIFEEYYESIAEIQSKIDSIDDEDEKERESNFMLEKKEETDATSALPFNSEKLNKLITKLEDRYHRVLESATKRVVSMLQVNSISSLPIPSVPSIPSSASHSNNSDDQSTPTGSAVDNSTPPHDFPSSIAGIDALVQRINCLESRVVSGNHSLLSHTPNIALPPIKLESFDGSDITKWPAYKYQLDTLILNQSHLSEVAKAFYVRSSLKGTAYALISTIPTHEKFLEKIIKRLEVEYGRRNLTQATLLQSLLVIRSKSDKLVDQIDSVRSMISLVHTIDEDYGLDGLVTQLQLAERIHCRFISFIMNHKPAKLLDALQLIEDSLRTELEEVTITRAISNVHFNQSAVAPSNSSGQSNRPKPSVAGDHSFSRKLPKLPICVYCGQHTYSGDCTSVKSIKDRKEILRNKSLCHVCFASAHSTAACSKKCSNCNGKHHKSICEKANRVSINTHSVFNKQPERLFNVKANVANPITDQVVSAHVHLDHGAQATLITKDLVNRLSLASIDKREMTISGYTGEHKGPSNYDIVNVVVHTDRGHYPIEAVVVPSINSIHTHALPAADLKVIRATLGRVPSHFSKPSEVHTDLLLSVGNTLELLEHSKETKLPCGFRLVQSSIGPIVVGSNKPRLQPISPVVSALTVTSPDTEETLENRIERMFSVDPASRVYETTEKEARKVANEVVNRHFDETIQKQGNEYVVQYSVKPDAMTQLPSNFDLATSRLVSTIKTLSKERANLEYYDSIISDQLSLGQVEKVDPRDNEGIVHYLAHQPVFRPDKPTTPLRIVYDASAHLRNKPCLNDMIHPGPTDLEQIPALLIRSRSRKTLIVADVEKAFLQVKLHPSQRNMLRFLWIKDLDMPVNQQNILVLRFCVTPFGVNASPTLLSKVITHHIKTNSKNFDPNLIHQLLSNIYVDNVIINVDHASPTMYTQSKNIFKTMSMNLREYASNDQSFNNIVHESDRSKDEFQKLLGILWNVKTDQLSIKIPISEKKEKVSKRSMLSVVATPYDPLGLLNPLTLPPRLTIQSLWRSTLKWDETVDDSIRDSFHEQMRDLENFHLSINRYSNLSESDEITLVAFSDASKLAMAACVYNWSSTASPTLLISRTRLAPIKSNSTIPKMELDSLVMAHSLIRYTVEALRKEFPNKPIHVYFYSDSAVVLHWCKPEFSKQLGIFVTNRVKSIRDTRDELTTSQPLTYHHPRHVRSEHNPADHATRGMTSKEMNNPTHQWWTGPEWLKYDPNSWPNEDLSSLQCPSIDSFPIAIRSVTTVPAIETVFDLKQFSTLRKTIAVAATVYRFISRCASKTRNPSVHEKLKHLPDSSAFQLSASERRFAINSLIRIHQSKHIHCNDSLIKKNLIFEDPRTLVWKMNTRLTNSNLASEAKSPLFIPTSADSTLARLIISDIHLSSNHSNADIVLNLVKRKYWIPRCRQIAKSVLKQCVPCRKTNNLPFRYPPSPVLPQDRVRKSLPFEHSGIDFAGPFHSNNNEKMYVVVITCLSSRLTHLEVVDSLLPSSFILAFKRFCSRRGTPTQITSDKATTFKMSSTLFAKPENDPHYLTTLRDCSSKSDPLHDTRSTTHIPTVGAICLIVDESGNTPRSSWKMGKILSLSNNSATLRSHAGRTIERPLNLLIPLEIHSTEIPSPNANSALPARHHMTTRNLPPIGRPGGFHCDNTFPSIMSNSSNPDQLPDYEQYAEDNNPGGGQLSNHSPMSQDPPIESPIEKTEETAPPPSNNVTRKTTGVKKLDTVKISKEISKSIVPVLTDTLTRSIVDSINETLIQSITSIMDDSMTVFTKNAVDIRASLHQLTTTVNNLASVVHSKPAPRSSIVPSPIPIVHHRNFSDASSSSSRTYPPRGTHTIRGRSRSRSPHSNIRNRSPSRPSTSKTTPSRPRVQCTFCQSTQHMSKDCPIVISVSTRNAIMAQESRCLRCFRPLNSFHRNTCEPDLCPLGCVTPLGVPIRHCEYFCPRNPKLSA